MLKRTPVVQLRKPSRTTTTITAKAQKGEDQRVTAYRQYLQERDEVREQERKEMDEKSAAAQAEANKRLAVLNQRLKAIGLDDLFETGVHSVSWSTEEGALWELWIGICDAKSHGSERAVNALLDRLERIATPA